MWRMPSETERHTCTWMAWPSSGYTLGDTAAETEEARTTWAEVAHAVSEFEPVRMVVDPSAAQVARDWLGSDVELFEAPLDDAWMRDIGPSFVIGEPGTEVAGRLGAVDWVFNGWGAQQWATWEHDAKIGRKVAEWAGAELIESPMINEGGGIHVDGRGTVLVTETVQRGEGRNSGWSREQVEAELARTIGAARVIWLAARPDPRLRRVRHPRTRRHRRNHSRGRHRPGARQPDPSHPDHAVVRGDRSRASTRAGTSSICRHPPCSRTKRAASTTATSTTWSATAASWPAGSTIRATPRLARSSRRHTRGGASSRSTPGRCSPAAAASTASPSSSLTPPSLEPDRHSVILDFERLTLSSVVHHGPLDRPRVSCRIGLLPDLPRGLLNRIGPWARSPQDAARA